MKRQFLLFLLILSLFLNIGSIYCQIDSTKTNKFELSFGIAPNYEHWISHIFSNSYPSNIEFVKGLTPRIGLNASSLISFNILKNYFVQTGIVSDNMGYKTAKTTTYSYTKNGQITNSYTYWEKVHYTYLGIPIKMVGKLNLSKKLIGSLDFGANYYFFAIMQTRWEGSEFSNSNDAYLLNGLSVNCSLGLHYKATSKHSVYIKPFFNYFITSDKNETSSSYKLNFYSVGVELGMDFNLRRSENK